MSLDGNAEQSLKGHQTAFQFLLTGDTDKFDMSKALVVHQLGDGSTEILPALWNTDTGEIAVISMNGASPFFIVAPLKAAEHTVDNPHTGDRSFVPFWIPLAVLAFGVIAFLLSFARKRKAVLRSSIH